jgi:hypothetical protein
MAEAGMIGIKIKLLLEATGVRYNTGKNDRSCGGWEARTNAAASGQWGVGAGASIGTWHSCLSFKVIDL